MCVEWKELTYIQRYSAQNVFNADVTELYRRILPVKPMLSREKPVLVRKSKERISLLVCANMTGTAKHPLLVIGKFQRPHCFSGVANLPTGYKGNKMHG